MFTYKIYDNYGKDLIFATQSFAKFMVEYHRLESMGITRKAVSFGPMSKYPKILNQHNTIGAERPHS
jgi:hypothetical protein